MKKKIIILIAVVLLGIFFFLPIKQRCDMRLGLPPVNPDPSWSAQFCKKVSLASYLSVGLFNPSDRNLY